MAIRTVKVSNVSLGASEQDLREFFCFSGDIEYVEMHSENERSQIAFVTFKDPQGVETAVLLSGATIVDMPVDITLASDYHPPAALSPSPSPAPAPTPMETDKKTAVATGSAVQKAEDVVSSMLGRGFVLGKDTVNKAKAFDEKHRFTSTATAGVMSLDQKIGLSEKFSAGTTIVNEKVKEVDERFQVSEKTKSALAAAEQTASAAGTAIMKNRYVLTGTSWVSGAFNRVTKAAEEARQKAGEESGAFNRVTKAAEEAWQKAGEEREPPDGNPAPAAGSIL